MTTYEIHYSNGRVDGGYETYASAIAAFAIAHPNCSVGHDGDLTSGGDRTLCWASEEDSIDDDGARAVASIVRR